MAEFPPQDDAQKAFSSCVSHDGIRAAGMCLNCQKLFCAACLNQFGQCASCGVKFPKAQAKRSTGALAEASRIGRGFKPRAKRGKILGLSRWAIAGLIAAAIGGAAYFQFDLIKRSLPKGKGTQIGAKGKPVDPQAEGQDYEGLMAKIEANKQTPEDVKRLDDLMAKIESGQENFSHIDPKKLERLNKVAGMTGRRGSALKDDETEERVDRRAAFDEEDDGISVGSGESGEGDDQGGQNRGRRRARAAGSAQGSDWPPIATAKEWFAKARDELARLLPSGDKK
jgi:hypothetical protein